MPSTRPRKKANTRRSPAKTTRMLARSRIASAVKVMGGPPGSARMEAGKALADTARKDPARVYPYFEAIAELLGSDSRIVCWNAMQILAGLAAMDTDGKVAAVLDRYLGFIRGRNMVSAANAIRGAGRIAQAKPELTDRIVRAILEVERAEYETAECRNVAIGHALDVLKSLWPVVGDRPEVAGFVRRQRSNSRAAVARRAERLAVCPADGGAS